MSNVAVANRKFFALLKAHLKQLSEGNQPAQSEVVDTPVTSQQNSMLPNIWQVSTTKTDLSIQNIFYLACELRDKWYSDASVSLKNDDLLELLLEINIPELALLAETSGEIESLVKSLVHRDNVLSQTGQKLNVAISHLTAASYEIDTGGVDSENARGLIESIIKDLTSIRDSVNKRVVE